MHASTPGEYAKTIPWYMTAETSRSLIEAGKAMRAAAMRRRAVNAARAAMRLEKRGGADRRFHTMDDKLAYERRVGERRRFENVEPMVRHLTVDIELPL